MLADAIAELPHDGAPSVVEEHHKCHSVHDSSTGCHTSVFTFLFKKTFPDFEISYQPDSRQQIAESWPISLDDARARDEWGWEPSFDLKRMTEEMIYRLELKKNRNLSVFA